MDHNHTIDQLNRFVRINQDAEAGLHTAAETIQNSELETLFNGYAKQHAKSAGELQAEIGRLGANVSGSGTLGGALHRGWMELKSTLSGHSAHSLLTSCESGEESAEIAYADAVDVTTTG